MYFSKAKQLSWFCFLKPGSRPALDMQAIVHVTPVALCTDRQTTQIKAGLTMDWGQLLKKAIVGLTPAQ